MIKLSHKGELKKTGTFLSKALHMDYKSILDHYGKEGVSALSVATPRRTGKTAESWDYKIREEGSSVVISWSNSNVNKGVPIALILQYGHGTGHGGYVPGRDYINPAMKPIFDEITEKVFKEVSDS